MKLEEPLRFSGRDRRAEPAVGDTAIKRGSEARFRDIDAVWRELLAMGAEIGGREPELAPELFAANDRAQNGVFAPEHLGRLHQVSFRDRLPDRRAADDLAIHPDRFDADHVEAVAFAEL